ncbi:hypothetical protein BEN71_15545 [Acinetobacter wuhouensis]|nr:hypothetical protein BEN71_15545 [Acinetobacter wuhouensis]
MPNIDSFDIFLLTARLSILTFVMGMIVFIFPNLVRWMPLFKNITRKNSLWVFALAIILFCISIFLIPEGFP